MHGIKEVVLTTCKTVTEKTSKNVTNEQVQKSGQIYKRRVGRKWKLDVRDSLTEDNSSCSRSQVSHHLLDTQQKKGNVRDSDVYPLHSTQAREYQKVDVSLRDGSYCCVNIPVSMK